MYVVDPVRSDFRYTEYFHLAWVFKRDIQSVLFLGLGAGLHPRSFMRIIPRSRWISSRSTRQWLRWRNAFSLSVWPTPIVDDARAYLEKSDKHYDLIVHDAYFSEAVPFHLMTREFFHLAVKR